MKELEDWVLKFTSEDNEYGKQQRVANTRSVIDAVYSGDNTYKFGCAFIRSLHGEKKPGSKDYERVACAGDMCHCIKKNAEEEENAKLLHLAETGNADLTGKLVKHVSWLQEKHTPYIIPKNIEYHCWGRESCKRYIALYTTSIHIQDIKTWA